MSEHQPQPIVRHCDVAIVGGSAAGLAAALQLCRQRRSVIVVDAGDPRNAPAAHIHGYLGHEGTPPADFTDIGRDEVRRYGGEVIPGRAVDVRRGEHERFRVELTGGHAIVARRVVAATGLVDLLPDIEGLAAHWGRDVIHCPFCHGFEVRDRRIVQIVTHPIGLHPTPLFRQVTDRLTVVVQDGSIGDADLDALRAGGVEVLDGPVARVVVGADERVTGVELADGRVLDADAIAVGPRFQVRAEPFDTLALGTGQHPSGLGEVIDVDERGQTTAPGVYAAGNVTDPSLQVLGAAAAGSRVGTMISFDLATEDLRDATRPSANQTDWDGRYGGDPIWSGNPNGSLVAESRGLDPGRALDIGAGEGGDAVWLAKQGWDVTASDISPAALARVAAVAERGGLAVECLHADANANDPFGSRTFDLVSAQYASIPRTPDNRGVRNLVDAVAPGGTLLVVSHDLEPIRTAVDTSIHSRPFDPDAYVRVEDVAAAVSASPDWAVEVHETRDRPAGAASASHHVQDVILRARRIQ